MGLKLPSWFWFVLVGSLAAAVHFTVVIALVSAFSTPPLMANVFAWMVAFGVSYVGHHRLSFRGQAAPVARSAARFALVSLSGLALNEAAYALLLHLTPLRYDIALALVLVGVAFITYQLGRHWAFAGKQA